MTYIKIKNQKSKIKKGLARLNFWNKKSGGFTLIETLVSLVILSVAMIPIMNLSSGISRVNSSLENSLVASGLAQEGVEVIRAIRDANWFNSNAFNLNLGSNTIDVSTIYQVEWNSTPPLTIANNLPLNLNDGLYTYTGGVPTKFSRTVTIKKVNTGELRVISTVTWIERGGVNKSIGAESHLFNWK